MADIFGSKMAIEMYERGGGGTKGIKKIKFIKKTNISRFFPHLNNLGFQRNGSIRLG